MRLSSRLALIASLVLTSACGAPQKPVTFATSTKPDAGLDVVSRTLAAEGQGNPSVDRQAGIARTDWQDTGYLFGEVNGKSASIVRRFTVVLAPTTNDSSVTVRIDAKRCAQGHFAIKEAEVRGQCVEMSVVPTHFQEEVDALGEKLRNAFDH